tara:strand:- start:2942 stop:3394 length:453 start_codon:yes stop_codon:yes gene_type:complete
MNSSIVNLKDELNNNNINQENYINIFNLLNQLTDAQIISFIDFKNIIENLHKDHNIFLLKQDTNIIGSITLIIEQKLIHNGKCIAHIEDFVIDKNYRNQGLSSLLLNYVKKLSQERNCYKIILDCNELLINFYEKHEFKSNGLCMRYNIL